MNADVEFHIRENYPWSKLPSSVRQGLANSQKEYEKAIILYSIKNQLRFKGNLVQYVMKNKRKYYEDVLKYGQQHLMLYPYHLTEIMVRGLRVTPFIYYINILTAIMSQEKSYDSLPNFTAADCLRLMGIGRNQYIDLMNQCRSTKKFFRRQPIKDLLPSQPIESVNLEPWWIIQIGFVSESAAKSLPAEEKKLIDDVIDKKVSIAGMVDYQLVHSLYRKGLVFMDVTVADSDCIIVPPLEGFVMNRVLGDYFETLLYKIFVSIDERTTVAELANVLEIDLQLVKNAVSMYCRLGFAKKKGVEATLQDIHPSWSGKPARTNKQPTQDQLLLHWHETLARESSNCDSVDTAEASLLLNQSGDQLTSVESSQGKRIAFLFDSTLTAFLMMGNLTQGLKSHAVTMFEVGKLSDESLDSFLAELEKVHTVAEGEAQRYFDHAITLRDTLRFLRCKLGCTAGVDLLRCESLLGLDPATCSRVLNKNYHLLVSMAPLSYEIRPVSSCIPYHLGPAIPEVTSIWFKLFIYSLTGCGPPSILFVKGTRVRKLPGILEGYDQLLVTTWGHDSSLLSSSNVLITLNDALCHGAVLVQGHSYLHSTADTHSIAFPLTTTDMTFEKHAAVQKLSQALELDTTCGYITLLKTGFAYLPPSACLADGSDDEHTTAKEPVNGLQDSQSADILASEVDSLKQEKFANRSGLVLQLDDDDVCKQSFELKMNSDWVLLDCCFGVPLFQADLSSSVCQRILTNGLSNPDSLNMMLHSQRFLSLRLLNFITEQLGELDRTDRDNFEQDGEVPLPIKCLQFSAGKLSTWLD